VSQHEPTTSRRNSYLAIRGRRSSYKWRAYPEDVLPAFVAEMDFELAPTVRDALELAVRNGDTGYAYPTPDFGVAFSSFAERRYDWRVDPENVAVIPDVMAGILEVLRRVVRPGAGVAINTPVYRPFFTHIAEAGCRVVEAPLAHSGQGYELDLDALERAFGQAEAFVLCNPHNPTGLVCTLSQLEQIVAMANRHDITVLSDEIHAPLVFSGTKHVPLLSIGRDASSRTISFHSASKAWNIPGLKCAQAVGDSASARAVLRSLPEATRPRTGHLGVIASTAAYADTSTWLDDLLGTLQQNHQRFAELLQQTPTGLRHIPPAATYFAWLDCRGVGLGDDPAPLIQEHGRVALDSGLKYGTNGAGYVRATLATDQDTLHEMSRRIMAALASEQRS
jgi:cystathionine beta-lyase